MTTRPNFDEGWNLLGLERDDLQRFQVGYGKGSIEFSIPRNNLLGVLEPNDVKPQRSGIDEIRHALAHPIGAPRLRDIVKPGERVAIVTSDVTRPMPSKLALPPVLDELEAAGVSFEDVVVVFALGSHRKQTAEEHIQLVGEDVYARVRCLDSDGMDCRNMGITSRGTPVDVFRPVADADRLICLGNIEFHYFAGYSGGAKALMPGVSSRAAIQANHRGMVRADARAGALEDNSLRLDIEEAATLRPIDFILNVVLDEHKSVLKAVAGHHVLAHREGCRFLDQLYKVSIPAKADIVIVTPGGYPKDINLYQAQKALDNSKNAVRDGGVVILAAACTEGLGEEVFERWMLSAQSPGQLIADIQENFVLGGHKAAAIALVMKKARICLVSDLDPDFSRSLFFEPQDSVDKALQAALGEFGPSATVLFMPYGGSTLPALD
ncbi:MAG: nickel-dependent lactate racemase [Acidobacteriota bacterium]